MRCHFPEFFQNDFSLSGVTLSTCELHS
jgi:hypothetical protein